MARIGPLRRLPHRVTAPRRDPLGPSAPGVADNRKNPVALLLSLLGGYVDTAGFLTLQGLFTAHVTGNFVTLGATLALGTSGAFAKLLALPVFCVFVVFTRLFSIPLSRTGRPVLRTAIAAQALLLVLGAVLAIRFGPFPNADAWPAVLAGLALVAAMSIQNAVQRTQLAGLPPTTLMTGTTTQIMIDVADLMRARPSEERTAAFNRISRMFASLTAFAGGSAGAAALYAVTHSWCFIIPPLLAAAAFILAPGNDASPGASAVGSGLSRKS